MPIYDRIISPTASQTSTMIGEPEDDLEFTRSSSETSKPAEHCHDEKQLSKSSVNSVDQSGVHFQDAVGRSPRTRASTLNTVTESPTSPPSALSPSTSSTFLPVSRAPSITSAKAAQYSAFGTRTKWLVALLGSVAALFSPLSSNIFVPAIPTLALDFNVTAGRVALGVSVYLIL